MEKMWKCWLSIILEKRGVLTNANTGQTTIQYYMRGLKQFSIEMLDYIVSINTNPELNTSRMKKEIKAVQNELMIHSNHPNMGLYNILNGMLFRIEGLIYQDDMPLQLKNLKTFTVPILKKHGAIVFMAQEI